jgi:hypothetical protein
MRIILLVLFLLILNPTGFSQVIPEERAVDWSLARTHFHFQQPENIIDVTDFGAVGDGETDNSAAYSAALMAAGDEPAVIFFPAGNFLFNSNIYLKNHIVIKGSGSGHTSLLFDFQGVNKSCITITGNALTGFVQIDSGYVFGSRKIITDSAFLFSAGQMIEIREENGYWDTEPASWAQNVVGQMTMVDSVSADTIFIRSPLRLDYKAGLNPVVRAVKPVENAGIECLKVKRLDQPESGGGYNIYFSLVRNSMVTGIESDTSVASHLYIAQSLNIKVTGSYFHHAFEYDGSATHGYGITLSHHASECLIENNIFEHLRHAMMVKTGANGNVFGYNFSTDVYRSEYPHSYGGDISLHGHYAYANLFEGNIVENIILDHYWGPSGPLNTFFRNRTTLWGIIFTTNSELETIRQNVAGNEVTNTDFLYGQYSLSGSDHFQYGNNVKGTIIPAGTDSLPDRSYYLEGYPDFWDIYCVWPSVGLPNPLNSGTIPAEGRYTGGENLTVCADSTVDHQNSFTQEILKVFPNPSKGFLTISGRFNGLKTAVRIFSLKGDKVFDKHIKPVNGKISIILPDHLEPGIYLLNVSDKNFNKTVKIYVQ